MGEFAASVAAAMSRLHPAWATEPGVVAVSGGADSVALLLALHEANPPGGFAVAHLNHQLRGAESDADAAFVCALAGQLGRRFHVEVWTVGERDGNLEAVARRVRYEWLARVAADTGAGWIATGHTADDQAETVLHRLIRGSGVTGLRGIAAKREDLTPRPPLHEWRGGVQGANLPVPPEEGQSQNNPLRGGEGGELRSPGEVSSLSLFRPLLALTRADVLAYLGSLRQPFRTDSSNADLAFTRNRIRAELLPLLRTFNPAVVGALTRLAEHAGEVTDWMADDTRKLLLDAELPRAGDTLVLDAEELSAAGEVRTRAALREIWDRERWPVNAMTAVHWRRAAAVALGLHPAADFPDGVHVRRAGKVVQLRRKA